MSNTTARVHGDYVVAAQEIITRIGKHGENGKPVSLRQMPVPAVPNNPESAAWQEYAIAKAIKDAAEAREKQARAEAFKHVDQSKLSRGKNVGADDAFVFAELTLAEGAMRVKKDLLLSNLMKRFNLSMEDAQVFVLQSSEQDRSSVRVSVVLKQ